MNKSIYKPTLYLPIEIKAREFYSHLLLAAECCKLGFRVYIGDKEGIFWLLKNKQKKAGVFFYKSQLGKHEDRVLPACEKIAILDQEIGLATNHLAENYKTRFPKNSNYDKYFLIGEKHIEVVKQIFPEAVDKLCVTGWPKFDLYNKKFLQLFQNKKNGGRKYILIASDFGYNSKKGVDEAFIRIDQSDMSDNEKKTMKAHTLQTYDLCRAFVSELIDLKASAPGVEIILRPHPGEDHVQWSEDFKKIQAVTCLYEGDIADWIAGAQLFVHRGSTTAIQSFMMGIPTVALDSYYDENRKCLLSYQVSLKSGNLHSMLLNYRNLLMDFSERCIDLEKISSEILIEDELASTKIAKEFASMKLVSEASFQINTASRIYYYWRQRLGNMFRRYIYDKSTHKYYKKEEKIQSGFLAIDAKQFYRDYDIQGMWAKDVAHNLIEIDSEI